jgi:hypothetical protein
MFAIVYKGEVLDTADTIEEAEYITDEYNLAFRENGAVKWTGVPFDNEVEGEGGAYISLDEVVTRIFN